MEDRIKLNINQAEDEKEVWEWFDESKGIKISNLGRFTGYKNGKKFLSASIEKWDRTAKRLGIKLNLSEAVAFVFVPNIHYYRYVHKKNGTSNKASNLFWSNKKKNPHHNTTIEMAANRITKKAVRYLTDSVVNEIIIEKVNERFNKAGGQSGQDN